MNLLDLMNSLKGLSHYESDIDATEVWTHLESKIHAAERDSRVFYVRLFGALLSIVLFVGIFLILLKNNRLLFSENLIDEKVTVVKQVDNNSSNDVWLSNETKVESHAKDNLGSLKEKVEEKRNTEVVENVIPSYIKSNYRLNSEVDKIGTSNDKQQVKVEIDEVVKQYNILSEQGRLKNNGSLDREVISAKLPDINHSISNNSETLKNLPPSKSEKVIPLPRIKMSLPHAITSRSIPNPDKCPLVEKKKRKIVFSIRPYADYDLPLTKLYNREGNANENIARNRLESNYVAYSFGMELRARTKSGIHIFTGINQSVIRDKFDYSLEKDTMILLEDVIKDISINENQDSVITIGDTLVNARLLETGTKFNTYKSYDIPFGFEISKRLTRFEIGISTTAIFNLKFSTKGSVADEEKAFSSIDGKYKNSIDLRFRISTPIQYYVGKNVNIGMAPSFTLAPVSISHPSYQFDHKVNLISMRAFVDYSF